MMERTVYIVRNPGGTYYGSGGGFCNAVPFKDAKVFSKKNTASACAGRGSVVVPCTLVVPDDVEVKS